MLSWVFDTTAKDEMDRSAEWFCGRAVDGRLEVVRALEGNP